MELSSIYQKQTTMTTIYRDFLIEVYNYEDNQQKCLAFLNGEPMFGTFSCLDKINALGKIQIKIDKFYNNEVTM